MKISIITVVYNGAATLRSCIDSVLAQDYGNLEYIIVDGNSKDGTQDIVKSYGNRISRFVSEKDKGIYDAMNKGVALATGDVVGILNADDFYAYNGVLTDVAKAMLENGADGCYGDLDYVDGQDEKIVKRRWISGRYRQGMFLKGWMPPHPTFFVARDCYTKWGNFRLDMGSAADYELMLRMIHKSGMKLAYVPKILVKMRVGGVSNSTLGNRIAANRNDRLAWKVNGLKPGFLTLWLKPLRKVFQFIERGS